MTRGWRRRAGAGVAVLAALLAAVPTAGQQVDYSSSLSYLSGSYIFTERAETWSLYNGVAFRAGRFRISAGLPVIVHNTTAVTWVGNLPLPTGGPEHAAVRQRTPGSDVPMRGGGGSRQGQGQGGGHGWIGGGLAEDAAAGVDSVTAPGDSQVDLGDPYVSAGFELFQGFGILRSVEITAAAKAPVASVESGVGTGEWDVGGGVGVALAAGRALVFADASWWRYGDLPDLPLDDGLSWGLGIGVPAGDRLTLLGSLSGASRIMEEVESPLSVTVSASWRTGRGSLSAGVGAGLSEATSDLSLYVGWRAGLVDRR